MKTIVLISGGQPSTNPRMVKEATALENAGFKVYVIYSYWTEWARKADRLLFTKVRWNPILVGGSPFENRLTYYFTRLRAKLFRFIAQNVTYKNGIAEVARGRTYPELLKKAMSIKADLYIAHILPALPVVVKAAQKHRAKCGFDAEDFHRQESSNDTDSFNFKISRFIEDKYLPLVDYITASSPLIAEKYASLYNRKVTTVLNAFPKTHPFIIDKNIDKPLKLFWFSQTIGPYRGLEMIIAAMGLAKIDIELHLLGQTAQGYKQRLLQMATTEGVKNSDIYFYEPIKADEIFCFATQFDIGLASDENFCMNRNIALTNKIFTYIQSGLAVVANNTLAQSSLLCQYPAIGKVYNSAMELSAILVEYKGSKELLYQTKKASFEIGQNQLNWENESQKFLAVIEQTLEKVEF